MVLRLERLFDLLRGYDGAFDGDIAEAGNEDLAAQIAFELVNGNALLGQHSGILIFADKAAIREEGGIHLLDGGTQLIVGDFETETRGFITHGAIDNHVVHHLRDVDGQHIRRELLTAHGALHHVLDFVGVDILAAYGGDDQVAGGSVGVVVRHQIGQHRNRYDEQQTSQHETHCFIAAAKQIKHC